MSLTFEYKIYWNEYADCIKYEEVNPKYDIEEIFLIFQ